MPSETVNVAEDDRSAKCESDDCSCSRLRAAEKELDDIDKALGGRNQDGRLSCADSRVDAIKKGTKNFYAVLGGRVDCEKELAEMTKQRDEWQALCATTQKALANLQCKEGSGDAC